MTYNRLGLFRYYSVVSVISNVSDRADEGKDWWKAEIKFQWYGELDS